MCLVSKTARPHRGLQTSFLALNFNLAHTRLRTFQSKDTKGNLVRRLRRPETQYRLSGTLHAHHQPKIETETYQEPLSEFVSFTETCKVAEERGLLISLSELGPFYRIVVREGTKGIILAVTNGFIVPFNNILHCDTLQIFNSRMRQGSEVRARVWGSPRGLGLLLGGATFAYGFESGCRKAEILAINDDDDWAKRLVRYYRYFGFQERYTVGGRGLADLPDLLVWGGVGTRMDADIEAMLRRWTPAIRAAAPRGPDE